MNANQFRWMASAFSVVSYVLLVVNMRPLGVVLNLCSQALLVPFSWKNKCYDMIGLSGLFGGISIHYLVTLVL